MSGRDLIFQDATSQLLSLAAGRVSAVELLKAELTQHERTHARLNAVVAADVERALERAKAIDDARSRGEALGPLAGLPMTVKDTLDVVGMAASSGLEGLRRRQVDDATAVAHVRRAGAVIWGKTNTPVMAADWQTYNRLYGTTNNPWDPERTPGGSSGGAAAALAAGVTALEVGSDIGGSLRVPASFCGVFSHKPTWGMVTQHGHVPPSPGSWAERDLNVVGPMARSARDLRLLLSLLSNTPIAPTGPKADLKSTRIGVWLDDPLLALDGEVRTALEAFAAELSAAGAQVQEITSPVDMGALLEAYVLLLSSTLAEDLPPSQLRMMEALRGPAKLARLAGAGPASWAASTLAYTARHYEWTAADAVRARLRQQMAGVFEKVDVILAPIAPVAAFHHNHKAFSRRKLVCSNGMTVPYTAMLGWISLATACHLPATAVPAGLGMSSLPVGAQIIGPRGADARTLAVAQAIDEEVRGFLAPEMGL